MCCVVPENNSYAGINFFIVIVVIIIICDGAGTSPSLGN